MQGIRIRYNLSVAVIYHHGDIRHAGNFGAVFHFDIHHGSHVTITVRLLDATDDLKSTQRDFVSE